MQKNGYLKFILTLLTVLVALIGYFVIDALDRVHLANLRLLDKLNELHQLTANRPGPAYLAREFDLPAEAETEPKTKTQAVPTQATRRTPFANAAFFDPAATPGGRLIRASASDTKNLNPLTNNDAMAAQFYDLCNAPLGTRNYQHPEIFEPVLAESWSIASDKRTYTVKLRSGIVWQDFTDPVTGKQHRDVPVTAHDFKFLFDVIRNPEVNAPAQRVYYQDVESVEAPDDRTLIVRWKNAYFRSLEMTLALTPLARHFYHAYPGPFSGKRFNEDNERNRMIVGCGAYQFVRWDKDRRIVFKRFPKYIGTRFGAAPAIENLAFDIVKHPGTRLQALKAGSLDALTLTPDQYIRKKDDPFFHAENGRCRLVKTLAHAYNYLGYNLRNELFQDKRVRQALTMLINRPRILRDVYFGLGRIVTGPFYPESVSNDLSIKPWPFDPARARRLLAAAGWRDADRDGILERNGKKFEFTMLQVANHPLQSKMLPIIKEDFAKVGIDMKIRIVEWSVYLQMLEQRNFEACCLGWTMPLESDPYQVWHSSQASLPGSSNHISFANPEADRLIEEIRRTFDAAKRAELCHQFQKLLHEEQPYTFLFAPESVEAISRRYRNVRIFPVGVPEDIWFAPRKQQLVLPGI